MSNTVIFLIFVILCSSASAKIKGIDEILHNLVQLNQNSGKDNSEVGVLLGQIASSLKESFEKGDNYYKTNEEHCSLGSKVIKDFVAQLETNIISAKNAAKDAKEESGNLSKQLETYTNQIKKGEFDIKSIKESLDKTINDYVTYGKEAEVKLVAIKSVLDIIEDELIAPQKSFIQIQNKLFLSKIVNLKKVLMQIHAKESMYSSVASALLQVAESKGFADQKILTKIIEMLRKLQQNVIDFRNKQETETKNTINDIKKSLSDATAQFQLVRRMYEAAKSQILNNETIIANSAKTVELIQSTINRKNEQLKFFSEVCSKQNEFKSQELQFRESFLEKINKILVSTIK